MKSTCERVNEVSAMAKATKFHEANPGSNSPSNPQNALQARGPETKGITSQITKRPDPRGELDDALREQGRVRGPDHGLEDIRREVYADSPEAERAYLDSRQRAHLGAGLKGQRRRAGLTLRQLAAKANWSPSYVSRLESATGPWPKLDTIRHYLAACGTDARCGLVIGHPTESRSQIDSATTISDGQECVFEWMAGQSVDNGRD
jgi:transcriptional regulator with XRE-family HTH domain